ncbi:hypothetical protein EV421DRAFT_1839476 [Armillaria borealis]|uniref:Uncharacterized protein n=1 Tax=Armillaria borealis TaxID=47425 RepID=A0AA39MI28_9AGAR|nr:hypothetical protein EV421DRAFT_1839476 [Armillaria borealis]
MDRSHLYQYSGVFLFALSAVQSRYLSESRHSALRARMEANIFITGPSLLSSLYCRSQSEAFTYALNQVSVIGCKVSSHMRYNLVQIGATRDLKHANWNLWIVSKRPHRRTWMGPL